MSRNLKNILVTTPIESTWGKDEKIIFLGEWCKKFSRRHVLLNRHHSTLDYHWRDRVKLDKDHAYLFNLYEKVLRKLSRSLNSFHSTNHSLRYWRIIVGPWLLNYLSVLFDRFSSISRLDDFDEEIIQFLTNYGLNTNVSGLITSALIIISIGVIVLAINFITRKIILSFFKRIAKSTASTFDDLLIKNRVPRLLSFIPSLFFLYLIVPTYTDNLVIIIEALTILLFIVTVKSVLSTVKDYFKLSQSLKHIPIDSYIQVIMIFLWFIGIILILSVLTGREIGTFLASLGALSAIIISVSYTHLTLPTKRIV